VVTVGFVSVTELGRADELGTAEDEEVEVTVGESEIRDELLDGAVDVTVAPSDAEQPANKATTAANTNSPNGLNSALSVIRVPLPAPRPAITRQQANASQPQIHIPAELLRPLLLSVTATSLTHAADQ
jgi:hypothetical protein